MIIEPTNFGVILGWAMAIAGFIALGMVFLPWNTRYSRKGEDPYRYCPKDEE